MLAINAIRNVNNTLNNNISFGYRSNELVKAPAYSNDMVEGGIGGLFTGFVGTLKSSPLFNFNSTVKQRTQSINDGLEKTKLNLIA
mgnify:FL=1